MATPRQQLETALRGVPGLEVGGSVFSEGPGYWLDAKEILHFDADDCIDLRLTRAKIRARSSDWLEVVIRASSDVPFVLELVTVAVEAHRR